MYRKGSYIVGRIAGLIAVLLLGSLVAVQTPFVQTKLTQKALEHLVPAMQGRIGYDELRILPSGVLLLKNAVVVDSNPYTAMASGPKPGASTNFATLAFAQSTQFYCILSGLGWLAPSRRICPSFHPSVYRDITRRTGKPACCKKINNPSPQRE